MEIIYKCKCLKAERSVIVQDRLPSTDILKWMELVMHTISLDHSSFSPMCYSEKLEYAKIPIESTNGIGTSPTIQ